MTDESLPTYLRDHLAGAAFGSDLARTLESHTGDAAMTTVAAEIEDDREVLLKVIEAVNASRNPAKEAVTWVGEKVSRLKFSDDAFGTFMGLEALSLGILGKRALWVALRELGDERLAEFDLPELIARAERQRDVVEALRLRHVAPALT